MDKKSHGDGVTSSGLHVVLDVMNEVEKAVAGEIQIHPRFPDLRNRLGLIRFKQCRFQEARECFEAAVSLNSEYVAARFNLAYTLMELGRTSEAESLLAGVAGSEARSYALAGIACLRMKESKLPEAASLLSEAAEADDRSALYPHNLGLVRFLQGDHEGALTQLKRAEVLCPPYAQVFEEAGLVRDGGLCADAFREYLSGLELNPFMHGLHDHLGHAYAANGLFAEARAEYRMSMRALPSMGNYYCNLALVESAQDNEDAALGYLRKAVEAEPGSVKARVSLGFEYSAMGKAAQAIEQFEAARALRPDYPDVRYNLGLLYMETERHDEALAELRAALRSNPRYSFARNSLAFALFKRGELDAALCEYRKVVAGGLCSSDILVNMGVIMRERGDVGKAIQCFDRAVSLNPGYAPAYYQLGLAYQEKGQKEKARRAWKAYLERAQDDAGIEDARKNITE